MRNITSDNNITRDIFTYDYISHADDILKFDPRSIAVVLSHKADDFCTCDLQADNYIRDSLKVTIAAYLSDMSIPEICKLHNYLFHYEGEAFPKHEAFDYFTRHIMAGNISTGEDIFQYLEDCNFTPNENEYISDCDIFVIDCIGRKTYFDTYEHYFSAETLTAMAYEVLCYSDGLNATIGDTITDMINLESTTINAIRTF